MPESLTSRNSAMGASVSSGLQQPSGSISTGRFPSTNLSAAISQIAHGHSSISNRGINSVAGPGYSGGMNGVGGSMSGINPNSGPVGNRNSITGLGVSPILGNAGPRITTSMGNIVGGNITRNISSGGLNVPGLGSRINLTANAASGNINVQSNRLKSGVLQQAPQMIGMLGNSYLGSGGPLSQGQVQTGSNQLSSMGTLNDIGSNDNSPFDMNDFPQLTGRPNSAGGPQGQLVSLRKQGMGVNSIVQQSQEFSIQNEDFPALPGYKGGSSDFTMYLHPKELHENVSMMQSQHFPMGRSGGFSLGGAYTSHRQQQQQHNPSYNVDFSSANSQDLHLRSSDIFPSHGPYHSQGSAPPSIGLRPLNSTSAGSGVGVYNQLVQQYQNPQNQAQFRLQQLSSVGQTYRDQSLKSLQGNMAASDRYGLMGILNIIRYNDSDLAFLALGIDLTTLGLNLNAQDTLYKTFGSPWSDEPAKGEPEYSLPVCYYAKQPPPLQLGHFSKFQTETLFYIFYSMPKDEAQLYAAHELSSRGWFYHKEQRLWIAKMPNVEPLVKTNTYERGSYLCFDPTKWETVRKDHLHVQYDMIEKKPVAPPHP